MDTTTDGREMPALFRFHDQRLGGTLTEKLREWAEDDEASLQTIAWNLRELDVEVTPPTVMRWLDRLGIARRHAERAEGRYNAPSNRGAA